jgi:hypothetical protein
VCDEQRSFPSVFDHEFSEEIQSVQFSFIILHNRAVIFPEIIDLGLGRTAVLGIVGSLLQEYIENDPKLVI